MNTAENLEINATIKDLLFGLADISGDAVSISDRVVHGIQLDSRLLKAGDLFLACFGKNHDARDYVEDAVQIGVSAVFVESGGKWQGTQILNSIPVIAVDNLFSNLSEIASRFYGFPDEKLDIIGITGTNGKTSCSQFIAQAFESLDKRCGVIGTLGYGIYGQLKETQLTTPDAVFTQMALSQMVCDTINPVVMEVSSVGLHQHRVKAVDFDIAVFTNLSRDHLDYHNSMEDYAENKKKLFTTAGLKKAVVNLDDAYALSILNGICNKVDISTYSVKNSIASVYASELELTPFGYVATIITPLGEGKISGTLLGSFNFYNVLAVTATLISYLPEDSTVSLERLCEIVSSFKPVTGRMEIIGDESEITAVVDYAHTPDGLKSALVALREHFTGQVWCVFGCGGNRDKGKRPLMGEIAETHADHIIITDDNPRNEDGDEIVGHVLSGIADASKVLIQRDRESAIASAISQAAPGDVVLIAGKGHETYQDVCGDRLAFSDATQVRLALNERVKHVL